MRVFFTLALILMAAGITIVPTLQKHHPDSSEPGHHHSSEQKSTRSKRFVHWEHDGHWGHTGDSDWWGHGHW